MIEQELFRKIPKVDKLLKEREIQKLCESYGQGAVVEAIRDCLEELRGLVTREPESFEEEREELLGKVVQRVKEREELSVRRVLNATGIILHTNLGRAPLGKKQLEAVLHTFGGYINLEYDLERGKRGKRWEHYASLIGEVTGSEGAIAVNNNAAAVTLILSALARGKEVVVSRGELIEIGGRFRIPEVMEESGAILREVGCTNRTRISDYEKAIHENTGALLKVHTSNYRILGFTEEASVEELVELGKKHSLPVIVDLGSGVLIDLEKYGLPHEPTVQEILKKGADLVCFSGDKLLGGPQAGIIAGKKCLIKTMEHHPLMRCFRLDKCTLAALEATFQEYKEERAIDHIPVLRMLTEPLDQVKERAEAVLEILRKQGKETGITLEPSQAVLGGGSMPTEELPSFALAVTPKESCESFSQRLRRLPIPIISHIKNDRILLDMRTISQEEIEELAEELCQLL